MRNRGFSPEIKVNAVVLDPKSDFITSTRIKNQRNEVPKILQDTDVKRRSMVRMEIFQKQERPNNSPSMRQNLKFDESLAMKKAKNMKNSVNLPKDDIKITRVPRKSEFEKAKDQYQ